MNWLRVLIFLSVGFSVFVQAGDIAVIVHKSNQDVFTKETIQHIYLGKTKAFPQSGKAVPLDLPKRNVSRGEFLTRVVGKTQSQYTAYWAKLMFTGKGVPPKEVDIDEEAVISTLR